MEDLPDDAVGISVRGVIDAADYAGKIVPAIEAKLARHEKIKVLYQVGPEFESFTPGAVWSDTRLGTANLARFSKVALVTDIPWMQSATRSSRRSCPARSGSSPTASSRPPRPGSPRTRRRRRSRTGG